MRGKLELVINHKVVADKEIDYISESRFENEKNKQIREWKEIYLNRLDSSVKWEIALKILSNQ